MQATQVGSSSADTGQGEGEISTFGWDTAFAVRIANVNAAIAARSVSPPTFSYVNPQDKNIFCKGEFGNWSVVRGGDGDGVNVLLPIRSVTGQMKSDAGYVAYSCASASITVTVRLQFFNVSGNQHHLKVNPTSTSDDVPVVEFYASDFGSSSVHPPGAIYALQAALMAWAEANLGAFEYVFSIVDLNAEADTGAWAFLKPTSVSYAYIDGPDDEDAFLGVLAMTLGENPGTYQQTLDARIVQPGEQAAFCISRPLLLRDIIFPNLQRLWPNLQVSDVTFSESGIQLNTNTSIDLPVVTYQGSPYTPQLKQFTLTVEGSEIEIDSYTETVVQWGVTAWCRDTSRYSITKSINKSGQPTLTYTKTSPDSDPDANHGHYIDKSVEITEIILAAILAIAIAALAVLTGGAAGVLIAVIGALIVGLIAMSPQIAGLIENGDAPAMDLLQANIVGPTTWTDSKDFTIDAVQLNGSMRLGGSLGFGSASAA